MPPRIAPVGPPYPEALLKWMPPGAGVEPLKLFRTLEVNSELARRMRPLGAGLLGHGRLSMRERELVIDRACARAGAEYEWGVHVAAFGEAAGLTEDELNATAAGAPGGFPDPADADLIALVDELHDTATVSEGLWERLATRYDAPTLLELLILAGWYRLIAGVINAVGIERENWAARFPATMRRPAHRAGTAATREVGRRRPRG
jgi:4-carboxymuconolactone decarboxylase